MSRNNRARQLSRANENHLYAPAHQKLLGLLWPCFAKQPLHPHDDLQEAVAGLIGKEEYHEKSKLLAQLRPNAVLHRCPDSGCVREIPHVLKPLQILAMTEGYDERVVGGQRYVCVPAGAGWTTNPKDYR